MDFLNNYLPNIIAGLVPALLVFAQSMYLIIKNLKSNKNVEELSLIAKKLKDEKWDLEKTLNEAAPLVKNLLNDFKRDFEVERDKLVDSLKNEFKQVENELKQTFEEQRVIMHEQIKNLRAENRKLKLGNKDNVSSVW